MIKNKKIKKQDTVKLITGKDLGKTGKVIEVDRKNGKVMVEGLNLVKKTMRKSNKNPNGGIKEIESFVDISNIMLICPKCKQQTRVGYKMKDKDTKVRICKKCKNEIE